MSNKSVINDKSGINGRSVKVDNETYEKLKEIKESTGVSIRRIIKDALIPDNSDNDKDKH